ncbi:NAD(P)-dependent alcohol dehydrogenase [Cryobacterium sandaracinum]|uniref:NAD(P)-dependent alcohol dehydrogenase n=1 Tax=Cryobacterium sandaracinum TaxID=1259247 RepID=A0ABY2J9W7_9MICO|nr:NAD(P)-dependent alcohol dehydrogenase [Cryobacterium sandaracinum]TFD00621.1 NAD(P)-dependent alcohol dehydrogenase [Cryobacterium sandaracinum]
MLGSRFGGHAEYVCIPQDGAITAKPRNMTFTDAVTLVFGGTTAHAFFSRTAIKLGSTVLVNGASGAVCTAAVQLAKQISARVTGVCSGANRELVTALGADRVIDYTTEDFLLEGQTYDVIMDCVGNASFERAAACLTPGGALLLVVSDLRGLPLAAWHTRRSGSRVVAGNIDSTADALAHPVDLAESGLFLAVIDWTYDLTDIALAHRFVEAGHKKGNVILCVAGG